mgnify:CR=1 FL=1
MDDFTFEEYLKIYREVLKANLSGGDITQDEYDSMLKNANDIVNQNGKEKNTTGTRSRSTTTRQQDR